MEYVIDNKIKKYITISRWLFNPEKGTESINGVDCPGK